MESNIEKAENDIFNKPYENQFNVISKGTSSVPVLTRTSSEILIENNNSNIQNKDEFNEIYSFNSPIETKLKSVFELPESESLIHEFPCYLIRLVTIPGCLYITTNYICFYASLIGKKPGPYKTGYLSKKNHKASPRTFRYYFELKHNILSWYKSTETKYSPLSSIDLKYITKIESSKSKEFGIQLSTASHQQYTLIADSELSQKEWLDELRIAIFAAQNSGNSIRLALSFSKITMVDKHSVFQFATNIRIKFQEDTNETHSDEDYYFAFFLDIDKAYQGIVESWRKISSNQNKFDIEKPSGSSGSFLSFDSLLDNISPAALPTMLMSKLFNMTNTTQPHPYSSQHDGLSSTSDETNELVSDDEGPEIHSKEQSSLFHRFSLSLSSDSKKKYEVFSSTSSDSSTPFSTKPLKRRSLFNGWSPLNPTLISSQQDLESVESQTHETSSGSSHEDLKQSQEQTQTTDRLSSTRHPSGIEPEPPTVTKTIQPDPSPHSDTSHPLEDSTNPPVILLPENQPTTEETSSDTRRQSNSFSNLRLHMSPGYLYNKLAVLNPITPTSGAITDSNDSPVVPHVTRSKSKRDRAKSVGSRIISGTKNILTSTTPSQAQSLVENESRLPKEAIWLSQDIIGSLQDIMVHINSCDVHESDSEVGNDEVVSSLNLDYIAATSLDKNQESRQKEQEIMNEHLSTVFPNLVKSKVEAVFKSSFWKTLPYPGKIYITNGHFCFNSKILAGQQKLIIPWEDVIQVKKLESRSYYLMYGMTMVVKDLTEEIYMDFSSLRIRDYCFSVCKLKADGKMSIEKSDEIPSDTLSLRSSSLLLDRDDHLAPPIEYDGPPLLTQVTPSSSKNVKYKAPAKPLHITCLTIGSRGDVQPYVALCKELQKDGHQCRIATHPEYEGWIKQHNIEFRSIGGDPGELMKLCIDNSFLSVSFIREGTKFFYNWFELLLESAYEACQGTDLIIESPSAMIGVHMAEKLQIPYFRSMPFPFTRTTKFPHPFAAQAAAGGRIYNDMTYVMIDMALWTGTARYVNRFRREVLKLPSTSLDRLELWKVPYLYSFSPTVIHPPKDWPDYIHCTGYWFLDNPDLKWKADPALTKFLDRSVDKRPILYIGFGSIIVPDPVETTRTIVEAVLLANVRAIICKGWSARTTSAKPTHKKSNSVNDAERMMDLESEQKEDSDSILNKYPDTIYPIDSVPHDWLFPQIQGVVHHGGAGTTAAGLRAGLPTVIKPFFGDQRFWGQRIEELQVGVCLNKLNRNQLLDALKTITQNATLITKAQKLGETIRQENGPRNAVECIYRELSFAKDQRVAHNS